MNSSVLNVIDEPIKLDLEKDVVSNLICRGHPVIEHGEITFLELEEIHKKMETEVGKNNAYFDDVFMIHTIHRMVSKEKLKKQKLIVNVELPK